MNKIAITNTHACIDYAWSDIRNAIHHAKNIKDPELTKKLEAIHANLTEAQVYIKSKTDTHTG
jgi:hypothetical protein